MADQSGVYGVPNLAPPPWGEALDARVTTLENFGVGGGLPVYNVKSGPYLAQGDGVTDDTDAINAAVTAANAAGGGIVYFPNGTYMVNADWQSGKAIRLLSNVTLLGAPGAVLQAITNSLDNYAVIYASQKDNIQVHQLTVIGDLDTHTGATGQWGHCIHIEASTRVRIVNTKTRKGWGDGIYIGSAAADTIPCNDVLLWGCVAQSNRRNGFSFVGCLAGAAIYCLAELTSGHDPQSGFDIEPNVVGQCDDFLISNCVSRNNLGDGFQIAANSRGAKVVHSIADGNQRMGVRISGDYALVDDVTVKNMGITAERGCIDFQSSAERSKVVNCTIKDCTTGQQALYVHSSAVDCEIHGVKIINCDNRGIYSHSPRTIIEGCTVQDVGYTGIELGSTGTDTLIRNCTVIRAGTVVGTPGRAVYLGCRAIVQNVFMEDVTNLLNAYLEAGGTSTGSIVTNCTAKQTAADTTKLPFRFNAAPALVRNCVSIGLKQYNVEFVGLEYELRGDVSVTVQPEQNKYLQLFNSPLTAARTVTLGTTRAYVGARFRIVRTANATGAFNLTIGAVNLTAAGQWAEFFYDGATWFQIDGTS